MMFRLSGQDQELIPTMLSYDDRKNAVGRVNNRYRVGRTIIAPLPIETHAIGYPLTVDLS